MSTRIFVSYAREDETVVKSIVAFLKAAGFETWFDKDNLLAGQDWRKVIQEEIARARLLLVCMSSHSVDKTGFVQKETRLALEQAELRPSSKVYIIPLKLDDCTVPEDIKRWHVLDLREQKASQKLLEAIGGATGEGARAPLSNHESLAAAIRVTIARPCGTTGQTSLGEAAREFLKLIEAEQDPERRGIVEIRKEIQPGYTHFFPELNMQAAPVPARRAFSERLLLSSCRLHACIRRKRIQAQTHVPMSTASPVKRRRRAERQPNPAGAVDAPMMSLFYVWLHRRRAADQHR